MRRTCLAAVIALAIAVPEGAWSGEQNAGRLHYVPSTETINSFFQGQLPAGGSLARYSVLYLHMLGEKPLTDSASRGVAQVFRVLVETRPHNVPVAVRLLIRANGSGEVTAKVGGKRWWLAGKLAVNRTSRVSREDVTEFLRRLNASNFWSMPAVAPMIGLRAMLGDPGWMLEGLQGSSYHVVFRGTSLLGSLRDAVTFLLKSIGKVNSTPGVRIPRDIE